MMRHVGPIVGLGSILLVTAAVHVRSLAQPQQTVAPNVLPASKSSKPTLNHQFTKADQQELAYIFKQAKADKYPPDFGARIQAIADEFRGYPYEPDSLDRREPETLLISLKKFDCVLFVEAILGLARATANSEQPAAPQDFARSMQSQRYRDGELGNYCSRLHYFSEWILDNQKRGLVKDLGASLDGVSLNRSLNFMSQNWKKYPRMQQQSNRDCIQKMEQQLGKVDLQYVPTNQISSVYSKLRSGDIIAVATRIPGLDVTHTGLVWQQNGQTGMIHAAPNVGVIVSRDLQSYVERLGDDVIGILVARPLAD